MYPRGRLLASAVQPVVDIRNIVDRAYPLFGLTVTNPPVGSASTGSTISVKAVNDGLFSRLQARRKLYVRPAEKISAGRDRGNATDWDA